MAGVVKKNTVSTISLGTSSSTKKVETGWCAAPKNAREFFSSGPPVGSFVEFIGPPDSGTSQSATTAYTIPATGRYRVEMIPVGACGNGVHVAYPSGYSVLEVDLVKNTRVSVNIPYPKQATPLLDATIYAQNGHPITINGLCGLLVKSMFNYLDVPPKDSVDDSLDYLGIIIHGYASMPAEYAALGYGAAEQYTQLNYSIDKFGPEGRGGPGYCRITYLG